MCELDNEVFVCSNCQKQFDHTQGSWPKCTKDGKLRVIFERADADEDSYGNYILIQPKQRAKINLLIHLDYLERLFIFDV